MQYIINLIRDDEANVWYSQCDTLPVALESDSLDRLIERVSVITPEVLELNNLPPKAELIFTMQQTAVVA